MERARKPHMARRWGERRRLEAAGQSNWVMSDDKVWKLTNYKTSTVKLVHHHKINPHSRSQLCESRRKMYRSGSSTRVSDEFFSNPSSADAEQQQQQQQLLLPTYNPESHLAKKERIRLRSAEAAVHLIPLLLIVCVVILWFFSAPGLSLSSSVFLL